MSIKKYTGIILAGSVAGAVNGLFGAGGGMLLIPLLSWLSALRDDDIFPASICIMLPISLVSLTITYQPGVVKLPTVIIYMTASVAGGILAGVFGKRIPAIWLHKGLGLLILLGGIRNLC